MLLLLPAGCRADENSIKLITRPHTVFEWRGNDTLADVYVLYVCYDYVLNSPESALKVFMYCM